MESSPPSPMPFEYGEGDKDKKEKDDKKKLKTLRIPLPASEVHTAPPKSFERLLPLFEKQDDVSSNADKDTTGLARKDQSDKADEEPAGTTSSDTSPTDYPTAPEVFADPTPHEELTEVHDTLWSAFEAADATPAVYEPSHTERSEGAVVDAGTQAEQQGQSSSPPPSAERSLPVLTEHEHRIDHSEDRSERAIPEPKHGHWPEEHTIHLNAPIEQPAAERNPEAPRPIGRPEDVIAAAPSNAGMAAEIAATEPDQESVRLWEEFDAALRPAATPEWHPEAAPLHPAEQFNDMMQRADMGGQFIAATSEAPTPAPAVGMPVQRNPGSFNTNTPLPRAESASDITTPLPLRAPENNAILSSTGDEAPDWYPAKPRYGNPGGSLLRGAAEAGLVGGTLAGSAAAHAAETGGLLAGGAAGMAAEHMAHTQAQQEIHQLQQNHAQELAQRDQHISALTNEQRVTHQQVEHLTQANHQLTEEQKRGAERAVAPVLAPVESERAHSNDETKVVHSEWIDMAVDKRTGRLAEGSDVNQFGDELRAEQRAESMPTDPLAIALAAAKAAARTAADVTDTYEQEHGQVIDNSYGAPELPSGQIAQSHELPSGTMADVQHRLPAPQSTVMSLVSNRWVWAGVAVLVLAFLVSAFIL